MVCCYAELDVEEAPLVQRRRVGVEHVSGVVVHRLRAARDNDLLAIAEVLKLVALRPLRLDRELVNALKVEQYLPPEVKYACLYWIEHLQKGGSHLYDDDEVHQFLKAHFLHWLEVLIRRITQLEALRHDLR